MAQKQVGMEQYYYWQQKTVGTAVPKLYYQSPKNWYTEFRYNYEAIQTASIHFGKKLALKKMSSLQITPVGGIIFGKLNGTSAGTIIEYTLDKFSFSSESQYVFCFKAKGESYFYCWSEMSYQVSSFFYAGFAMQQTKYFQQSNFFEPGIMAGISIRKFDIPIYCFSPTSGDKNFVLGINWRWEK